MNPDYYYGPLYPESTVSKCIAEYELTGATWVYLFRVHDNLVDIICSGTEESVVVSIEEARKEWARLVKVGYKLTKTEKRKTNTVNKHLLTDDYASAKMMSEKMYKKAYEYEWESFTKKIKDVYHENDLMEMRINPKKFYKNYALEA